MLAWADPGRPACPGNSVSIFCSGVVFPGSSVSPAGKGPDFASFTFVGIPALIFVSAGTAIWAGDPRCHLSKRQ